MSIPGPPFATELVVTDLVVGSGQEVQSLDTIRVHYVGVTGDDGLDFDSSWERSEPTEFPLGGVIPGWEKGLMGMRVGGRRHLVIPPEFAYGREGREPEIGPNDTLNFVVDLIEIR